MTKRIAIGTQFSHLIVLSRAGDGSRGQPRWDCECDCGAHIEVFAHNLRSGNTKSCGGCGRNAHNQTKGSLLDRLLAKVSYDHGCWRFTGTRNSGGYGQINRGARGLGLILAHRAAWTELVGPITDGLQLDHLCRNPSCVNPMHLEPVTHAVNMARGEPASRTHCPAGHAYVGANIQRMKVGKRCAQCHRDQERERKRRSNALG